MQQPAKQTEPRTMDEESSPPFSTRDNEPSAILATWTALEALSPQTFARPEDLCSGEHVSVLKIAPPHPLPWSHQIASPPGKLLYYQIVLGSIHMDQAYDALIRKFGQDEEAPSRAREKAAIAVILVDQYGVPVKENGVAVSSFAWALPQALQLSFNELGNWPIVERRVLEKLEDMVRRVDEDGNPIPLDQETINLAYFSIVEKFDLPPEMVAPPGFALRICQSVKSKKTT